MKKWTFNELDEFGRTQLSDNFFMRDFLYSEISQIHGIPNLPNDPDLAIQAGRQLCEKVLEPIQSAWGRLTIRSAYRSEAVNQFGNENRLNCSRNEANYAAHIWDRRDSQGNMGATACIVIPAFLPYLRKTGDWTALAWWIHEHIPDYHEMCFFSKNAAFNIRWYEDTRAAKTISSFAINPHTGDKKALLNGGSINPFYLGKDLAQFYDDIESASDYRQPRVAEKTDPLATPKQHKPETIRATSAPSASQTSPAPKQQTQTPPKEPASESTDTLIHSIEVQLRRSASRLGMTLKPSSANSNPSGYMFVKKGKTQFTVYRSGTDTPGHFEIAFNPNTWSAPVIDSIQGTYRYAIPKSAHKWPRAAIAPQQLVEALCRVEEEFTR